MGGYVIAAIMIGPVKGTTTCYGLLCWRWPLLVEWIMLVPFCIAVHFVPSKHLAMRIGKEAEKQPQKLPSLQVGCDDEERNSELILVDEKAPLLLRIFSPPNPRTVSYLCLSPLLTRMS
jgi:hypothetical protein